MGHAADTFGDRADRYAKMAGFSDESYYRPIIEAARPVAGDTALDIATGTGFLPLILSRFVREAVGCDPAPEMLAKGLERPVDSGLSDITLVEAPADALPFPDAHFSLATCRFAFHHFPDPAAALAEAYRVLLPGGRLVIEDIFGPGDNAVRLLRERIEKLLDSSHVVAYRPGELQDLLEEAGFSVESIEKKAEAEWPLELILELDRVEDPFVRTELTALLRENLDRDLGGFTAIEIDGSLALRLRGMIAMAGK